MSDDIKKLEGQLKKRGIKPEEVVKILKELERADPDRARTYRHTFSGKRIRFGALGDQHFGNRWTDKEFLNQIYDQFKKSKVEFVLNTGDLTDGPWQRHHNVTEQYAHGMDQQVKDFCKDYPEIKGVKTYVIDGNHDGWYRKMGNGSVGEAVAQRRKDIVYLGADEGIFQVGKVKIMLSHPDDGSAYAYSYKPQKFLESMFKMGETIPDVILQGHYHKIFYMNAGGVHFFSTGTTERQTPWMRGKKISADLGAWIIDIYQDKRGLTRVTSELLPYKGNRHDMAIK